MSFDLPNPTIAQRVKARIVATMPEEQRAFIEQQRQDAKGNFPRVTCGCGVTRGIRWMYRCWYCDMWLCEGCAEIHFKTPSESAEGSRETQATVAAWVNSTFGPNSTVRRAADRANEEMIELGTAIDGGEPLPDIVMEAADVLMCLYMVAERAGLDLHEALNGKMRINRARKWEADGTGCGYHVKNSPVTPE